jgi:hypothetical protein
MHSHTPFEVDRDHAVEGLLGPLGGLLAGRFDVPAGDAGVVERAVEPAIGADHAFDHRADIRVAGDVARQRYRLAARGIDLGDGFAGGFGRDIGNRNARAFARKGQGGGAADPAPAPATGDQRRFSIEQPGHRSLLIDPLRSCHNGRGRAQGRNEPPRLLAKCELPHTPRLISKP